MQMRSVMRGIGLLLVVSIAFGQDITTLMEKHRENQTKQRIRKESISQRIENLQMQEQLESIKHNMELMRIRREKELAKEGQVKVNMQGYVGEYIFVKDGLVLLDGSETPLGKINLSSKKVGNFYMESPFISTETGGQSLPQIGTGVSSPLSSPSPVSSPSPPPPPPPPPPPSQSQQAAQPAPTPPATLIQPQPR